LEEEQMHEHAAEPDVQIPETTDQAEPVAERPEEGRVRAWRIEQFLALGFGIDFSALLAELPVDLNDARRLIGLGCPPDTAVAILG
jgi:hypothetical protein